MKSIRNVALVLSAGSALAFGAAYAQDARKPEPQAKSKEHRMERMNEMHGHKQQMRGQRMQGMHGGMKHGCPEMAPQTDAEHNHS